VGAEWKFQQAFGDAKVTTETLEENDIISTVEFDRTGNYLAIGDKGGRIVILQRNLNNVSKVEYKVMTEFQSHSSEFDYLKSIEIEEKINKIRWLPPQNKNQFLLSTNDKTIKLWKIFSKTKLNFSDSMKEEKIEIEEIEEEKKEDTSKIPKISKGETSIEHQSKKIFANTHAYHINSLCLNSDGETFLSADDLRINMWNMNYTSQSFTIVDIKPTKYGGVIRGHYISIFSP